ncbi:hypothetical protein IE81DRAFT_349864 [Ceraceosorus guamensis]|uniref:EthD domain-containing protein n=1 Tax=Ceraceosorus guamensis TaxID=1522189 RepID=A0A316VQ60_9BASI|nr:hypothetical protein IE81DRAFT_349864 [Ceraceosorus guamensis]PWN39779.1 hypothetical protein IE81DRAFT_349864 [Ceraceosorus guamensis]
MLSVRLFRNISVALLGILGVKAFENPKRHLLYRVVNAPQEWGINDIKKHWATHCVKACKDQGSFIATEDVGYFSYDPTTYLYCYDEHEHSWATEAADSLNQENIANRQWGQVIGLFSVERVS